MKTPRVRKFIWEMWEMGTWLDPPLPDPSQKPYASYVADLTTFHPAKDTFAVLKLDRLLRKSGATEAKLREIFQQHPDFESIPVRCKISTATQGYDPYTAFTFLFNSKKLAIFIPWDWDTSQLSIRSSEPLTEPELGTFMGKTLHFLKGHLLPSAPQPNPLTRFLRRKLKPYLELFRSISRSPGAR